MRRSLLYVGLAVAFLVVFSLIFLLSVKEKTSIPRQWFFLAGYTTVLAYAMIKESREYWVQISFWFLCAAIIAAHLAVFIPILRIYPEFRPVWFWPIVIVEAGAFGVICELLLPLSKRRRRGTRAISG